MTSTTRNFNVSTAAFQQVSKKYKDASRKMFPCVFIILFNGCVETFELRPGDVQQVGRGRNVQSLFLLLFCLNLRFYANENIKMTLQRKQDQAAKMMKPACRPSMTPCLQGSEAWSQRTQRNSSEGRRPGVNENLCWIFLAFAFGGLSKQFGRAHVVVFCF